MQKTERDRYLEAYYENEYNANKEMSYALAFAGILIAVIWIMYLIPGIFNVTPQARLITCIALPVVILLFWEPILTIKFGFHHRPGFKYFIIGEFIFAIAILNIIIPKHAIIGWALCIVLTNHYYNPKICKITYLITLIAMLLCIYAAMFLGEYDPNLLMGEAEVKPGIIHTFTNYDITFADNPKGRFEYLHYLKEIGYNRYWSVFIFYYFARALILTIIFFVCNGLNKRTYNLLVDEIKVGASLATQSSELELAGKIQLSVLPDAFESNKDVEITAILKPTKEVGGDFYDYYKIDDNHVAILIADVSGKGMPAAMFMMKAITCFKNFIDTSLSPKEILAKVNASVYNGNVNDMFLTCFLGILDIETGVLTYANAGHNPPIIGHNFSFQYLKCNSGFILGGFEDVFVCDEQIKLEPGDSITLYTDGITEARNEKGEFFQEERLLNIFNSKEYDSIFELQSDLKDELIEFRGKAPQSDDITILTLKYRGDEIIRKEIEVLSRIENLDKINQLVDEVLEENDILYVNAKTKVVIDEIYSNISKFAYTDEGKVYFRVTYNLVKKELTLTFIDSGVEFDPLNVEEDILGDDYMNKEVGGLGIIIVKQMCSKTMYYRLNGKNILNLKISVEK